MRLITNRWVHLVPRSQNRLPITLLLWLALGLLVTCPARSAQLVVLSQNSVHLAHNPLHDSSARQTAVFVPSQFTNGAALPVVYYLPGFGNSSASFIAHSNSWCEFVQSLADHTAPVIFAVVDARTHWACSQYLNSPAQGDYADFICDEIVSSVEARFPSCARAQRIIAGHSSGGFGALRLGLYRTNLFSGVIALSPDSDFPVSHYPLVVLPAVAQAPLAAIEQMEDGSLPAPKNGDLLYAVALSAAYAPDPQHPGRFEWLYDANGKLRPAVWQRWLDNDPLTIVQRHPDAFAARQSVYLEGAAQDEYSANVGARAIYSVIHHRPGRTTFYEPPGHHADHLPARIARGIAWVLDRPTSDIP